MSTKYTLPMADLAEDCSAEQFREWGRNFLAAHLNNLTPSLVVSEAAKAAVTRRISEVAAADFTSEQEAPDAALCLTAARILSRDRQAILCLLQPDLMTSLERLAGLANVPRQLDAPAVEVGPSLAPRSPAHRVAVEALKVMSNLALQTDSAVEHYCTHHLPEAILNRTRIYEAAEASRQVHYFDMRLLLLLTAKHPSTRARLTNQPAALGALLDGLEGSLTLENSAESAEAPLSTEAVDCVTEYLKVLFNLSSNLPPRRTEKDDDDASDDPTECGSEFDRLVSLLCRLLLRPCRTPESSQELLTHSVNLLTAVPGRACTGLLLPRTSASREAHCFEEHDLRVIDRFLTHLQGLLARRGPDWAVQLMALLHALSNACRHVRPVRKFCRLCVLPPLRDEELRQLPEEGGAVRNRLCALLTSPNRAVKQAAAVFLFVLCKENAGRAIKYTGYGNLCGFLADVGLMAGGRSEASAALYSSESSDSDTEEYERLREQINPVTGRWEAPKPSPMEGMSEERKEYEAHRLMQHIDKLQRGGLIQPGIIGEDGRVRPARHVLELVENAAEQQQKIRGAAANSDSDSD